MGLTLATHRNRLNQTPMTTCRERLPLLAVRVSAHDVPIVVNSIFPSEVRYVTMCCG
jgi:hypothetical protein